jgi:hypothetical protein
MFGPVGRKQTHTALRTDIVAEGHQPRMRCHFGVRDHRFFLPCVSLPRHLSLIGSLRGLCGICAAFAIGEALSLWTTFAATVAVDVRPSLKQQMQQGFGVLYERRVPRETAVAR